MINFDDYANENKTKHNQKWSYIPYHPHRILIIGDLGSGKTNALLNLINNQPDIDKIYLYAKDPYEAKYQFLINKRESAGLKRFNDPKAFTEYSNDMQNVYKNIDEYIIDKELKILIGFEYMIADMINNKKLNSVVAELFIRDRELNIFLVFLSCNHTLRFQKIHKIHKIYKKCTSEPYSFLINDDTLESDNPLRFRKNLFNI